MYFKTIFSSSNRKIMTFFKHLILILTVFFMLTACSDTGYKFKLTTTQKTTLGENASITFQQIKGKAIDSVQLYLNNKRLTTKNNTVVLNTTDLGVGKHIATALVFYPKKVKKLTNFIEVFANKEPIVYGYKIINEYPHDTKAYTQGLEFYKGFLYETTGRKGQSWLRKVDYKTGKVLQQKDLDKKYFGEGMTVFNNKIFWLTWQAGKGFIYNVSDFKTEGEFKYNKSLQGWGLTHNNRYLIKSDGSNKIWFLNPDNQEEIKNIQAYTNKLSLKKLNELEYVDGKIYANYWQKPLIAIINPDSGTVEGIINLKGLVNEMKKTQNLIDQDDVLNGIAYNSETKRLFVTGKHWGKLFEIELVKQ